MDFNISNYLRISWIDVLLVCISTALIVFIARKFFWKKLQDLIAKRQDYVQQNIDSSIKMRRQAQEIKDDYDSQLKAVGVEANKIIAQANEDAKEQRKKIIEDAKLDASHIRQKAREDVKRQKMRVQNEMSSAIRDVAIEACKQVVSKEVDEKMLSDYIDDFIKKANQDE